MDIILYIVPVGLVQGVGNVSMNKGLFSFSTLFLPEPIAKNSRIPSEFPQTF